MASSSPPPVHTHLALLALHDRGAGVLAHRQHAAGGDGRVLQQVERDEAVVVAGLGVVEDVAQLLQVARPQEVGDVAHRLAGEPGDGRRVDLQHGAERRLDRAHALGGDQAERRVVVAQGEQLGELELGGSSHGEKPTPAPRPPPKPSPGQAPSASSM